MKSIHTIAFLLSSSLLAHAAGIPVGIPITALPLTITTPGNYYLVANLYYAPTSLVEIPAIQVTATGPVTIDLRGFSLSGYAEVTETGADYDVIGIVINSSNVTIKNGSISGFYYPIEAGGNYNNVLPTYIQGILLEGITFQGFGNEAVQFSRVNNSVVRNCTFPDMYISDGTAITDFYSETGNTYLNNVASNQVNPININIIDAPGTASGSYVFSVSITRAKK